MKLYLLCTIECCCVLTLHNQNKIDYAFTRSSHVPTSCVKTDDSIGDEQ